MTFGITLGEHLMMAPSASMFYIAIFHKDKTNMEVAASNIDIKILLMTLWTLRCGKSQKTWHELASE